MKYPLTNAHEIHLKYRISVIEYSKYLDVCLPQRCIRNSRCKAVTESDDGRFTLHHSTTTTPGKGMKVYILSGNYHFTLLQKLGVLRILTMHHMLT